MYAAMVVREYDAKRDCRAVEEVEKRCDVRATGKLSLHTDLLGDPVCRVRHSPTSLMLVLLFLFTNRRLILVLVFDTPTY